MAFSVIGGGRGVDARRIAVRKSPACGNAAALRPSHTGSTLAID